MNVFVRILWPTYFRTGYRHRLGRLGGARGKPVDINRLFEQGYAEIDHALPYSRSFDDSKNNRVLVLTRENRNKGNMTPYEYLGGAENSPQWQNFVGFVNSDLLPLPIPFSNSLSPTHGNSLTRMEINFVLC